MPVLHETSMYATTLRILALMAFSSICVANPSSPSTSSVPIAAGLWEVKTTLPDIGNLTESVQVCIGEGTDLVSQLQEAKTSCSKKNLSRHGNTATLEAICTVKKSTATIKGTFTGDFKNTYSGTIHTSYNPPLKGVSAATLTQTAQRLGPCAEGQKPGEVSSKTIEGLEQIDLNQLRKRFGQ